ncbi:MAG: 3-phosphoshikimate 1-carboxyvinyltransferase [Lachnospiraceae bacterium]
MTDIAIRPFRLRQSGDFCIEVPGSKSITNRALLLAALADGKSTLSGVLFSDDSRHFLSCLTSLGFRVEVNEPEKTVVVYGEGGRIPNRHASIDVGSAGTAARFLSAFLGISEGCYHIQASEQMKKRPMRELFASLSELQSNIHFEEEEGFLPVTIQNPAPLTATEVTVDIEKSSQFLSALLISACLLQTDFTVKVSGTHGMAYIDMTVAMMEQFGVQVKRPDKTTFVIPAGQHYKAREYRIEPDMSAACYFYAMAPLCGISMTVKHIPEYSLQGDIRFLKLLEQMGCKLSSTPDGICITGNRSLHFSGITADLSSFSDQTMTLAAIAPFADSITTITGIGHIRYQECDRLHAILNELTRLGVPCEELPDGIRITPHFPNAAEIETYQDHRMAMAFSLVGLRIDGIVIKNAECCAKTFENYFEVLNTLYQ